MNIKFTNSPSSYPTIQRLSRGCHIFASRIRYSKALNLLTVNSDKSKDQITEMKGSWEIIF